MIGHINKSGLMKRSVPRICVINYYLNAGRWPGWPITTIEARFGMRELQSPFPAPRSARPASRSVRARTPASSRPGQPAIPGGPLLVRCGSLRVAAGRASPSPGCRAPRRLSKLTFALANPPAGIAFTQLQIVTFWRLA